MSGGELLVAVQRYCRLTGGQVIAASFYPSRAMRGYLVSPILEHVHGFARVRYTVAVRLHRRKAAAARLGLELRSVADADELHAPPAPDR